LSACSAAAAIAGAVFLPTGSNSIVGLLTLISLVADNTMVQETILRLNGLDNLANPIIVCNAEHRFLVAEQCQQINVSNPTILLEPVGRNTAPAIAAAALQALKITDKRF
jgi:mannose-1-phosphate guanylyltransferase